MVKVKQLCVKHGLWFALFLTGCGFLLLDGETYTYFGGVFVGLAACTFWHTGSARRGQEQKDN